MEFVGRYQHIRSENLDGYFQAVGVPYMIRLMITRSNPEIEIKKEDDEVWSISTKSLLRTVVKTFKLNKEYFEDMPGTKLKNVTSFEDGNLITRSVAETGNHKSKSTYKLTDEGMTMTLLHEATGQQAVRHFKKL